MPPPKIKDTQAAELIGCNRLGSETLRDGPDVAVPGRSRKLDGKMSHWPPPQVPRSGVAS
jgi:hypothetical protein